MAFKFKFRSLVRKLHGWPAAPVESGCPPSWRPKDIFAKYDVFVHVGAPKAGSSAIQYFLHENAGALAKLGYYYPEHDFDVNRVSGGHARFGRHIWADKDEASARQWVEDQLNAARKKRRILLISAESLFIYPDVLARVLSGFRVRIVIFFRDPLSALFSNYNQAVKRNLEVSRIDEYCTAFLERNDASISGRILQQWISNFSRVNVSVAAYDPVSFSKERLEIKFLRLIGLPEEYFHIFSFPNERINSGYTLSALEFKRMLNTVLDRDKVHENNKIDRCLQAYSDQSSEPRYRLEHVLSGDMYRHLVSKYAAINKYVKETFFSHCEGEYLDYPDPDSLNQDVCRAVAKYTPGFVLGRIVSDHVDVYEYIKECVCAAARNGKFSLDLFSLANLVDVDIDGRRFFSPYFSSAQIEVFRSEEHGQLPDVLREIAISLEQHGQNDAACAVIARARVLRPGGALIQTLHQRILSKVHDCN